ncbi:unnamed protein product [Protopolystoma xenopodis]|uniref:Uncharacterized protein n=1 Tax=Protopolystoma xenopodis TaxID=117903 RepID=A0A3S5B8T6_9PLAT|nr:unnamed protein product [Protopolystoma xenopodis]
MDSCSADVCQSTDESLAKIHRGRRTTLLPEAVSDTESVDAVCPSILSLHLPSSPPVPSISNKITPKIESYFDVCPHPIALHTEPSWLTGVVQPTAGTVLTESADPTCPTFTAVAPKNEDPLQIQAILTNRSVRRLRVRPRHRASMRRQMAIREQTSHEPFSSFQGGLICQSPSRLDASVIASTATTFGRRSVKITPPGGAFSDLMSITSRRRCLQTARPLSRLDSPRSALPRTSSPIPSSTTSSAELLTSSRQKRPSRRHVRCTLTCQQLGLVVNCTDRASPGPLDPTPGSPKKDSLSHRQRSRSSDRSE